MKKTRSTKSRADKDEKREREEKRKKQREIRISEKGKRTFAESFIKISHHPLFPPPSKPYNTKD